MLDNLKTLQEMHLTRLTAVIRGTNVENAVKTADACVKGQITNLEIAFTTPHADQVIQTLSDKYETNSDVIVGAGTVLDPESALIAIMAGAKFIVSPSYNSKVAITCNLYSIPYIPGCFSPTEVQNALETGSNVIKIFPSAITGPSIISELKGPFPKLNIMPSGGVNLNNLKNWLDMDAFAIGIGGSLVGPAKENDYEAVTTNAKKFVVQLNKNS